MRASRCWLLAAALLLASCGYQPLGRQLHLPAEVRSVHIEPFVNRTLEPFLEIGLSDAVIEEFSRRGTLQVVSDPQQADARLQGEILSYQSTAVAFGGEDRIARQRATLTIRASLRQLDSGKVLWRGELSWSEEYPASLDKTLQEGLEDAAVEVINRRLAENLYFTMLERF